MYLIKTDAIKLRLHILPLIFFALFFFSWHTALPQVTDLKFRTFTTNDGLVDNYVVKVVTDAKGFLWIGTRNGLSKFDGVQFTNYTIKNGLRSTWVTDLIVDNSGTLWASTEGGICYFDEPADHFKYIHPEKDLSVLYKAPMHLDNDILWVATESGLKKINTKTKVLSHTDLKNIADPQSLCFDNKGNIWISTRGFGLFIYSPEKNTWKPFHTKELTPRAHLMDLYKEGNYLWAATSEGLIRIDENRQVKCYNRRQNGGQGKVDELTLVTSFQPLGDSLLICGTYSKGIAFFNKHTEKFTHVFKGDAAQMFGIPTTVFNDAGTKGKILWLCTDKGLVELNMDAQDFTTYFLKGGNKDWEFSIVKSIIPYGQNAEQKLVLINRPGAVLLYDYGKKAVDKTWLAATQRNYKNLLSDGSEAYWAIHTKGIDRFSMVQGLASVLRLPNNLYIHRGMIDREGVIWLGSNEGLVHYDPEKKETNYFPCSFTGTPVENTSSSDRFLTSDLIDDGHGVIWLASGKYGLFSFDKKRKTFTPHRQQSNKAYETKNRCSSLALDKQGNIWIGNMSGLSVFNTATKRFKNFAHTQGLQSSYVYSIAKTDQERIVGRGNSGIFSFDIATEKFANYPVPVEMSSHLLEQKVAVWDHKVWVGILGGFSVYNQAARQPASHLSVYVTSCRVRDRLHQLKNNSAANPAAFDYRQNVMQINYACVDFNFAKNAAYRYRLIGSSDEWINAGNLRSVLFTDLAPGRYTFQVKAIADGAGVSQQPAELHFIIQPPFWKTLLFQIAVILIATATISYLVLTRIRNIKRTEKEKTAANKAMAELEMKALRSQMNPHFIFNSLNSIQKYIWENKEEAAAEYLTKFSTLMRAILENSAHKLLPLCKELQPLELYLELEHRRSNNRFSYTISIGEKIDQNNVLIPPLLLQPYIENAIWHGLNAKKSNGLLTVSILQEDNMLACTIDDNGIGRKASLQKKGAGNTSMGINISQQRIELMQAESGVAAQVTIHDKYDAQGTAQGTQVLILLPIILHHA